MKIDGKKKLSMKLKLNGDSGLLMKILLLNYMWWVSYKSLGGIW